jgi:hypothetical protein
MTFSSIGLISVARLVMRLPPPRRLMTIGNPGVLCTRTL